MISLAVYFIANHHLSFRRLRRIKCGGSDVCYLDAERCISPSGIRIDTMSTLIIQLALAILLFFAVNWIGEHSSSFGYLQLSLLVKKDEAPAFNFVLKTLAPTAYIILVATALYIVHRNSVVHNIWLVAVYYFIFRLFYNIVLGRALLLNWVSIVIQTAVGIGAAYLAYVHLILPRHPLLPDVESIGNQLWIVIALFLYATLNNVRTSSTGSARRKNKYLRSRFNKLKRQYGVLIDGQFPERYMELVTYAILIYETFNRPWLARLIERVMFPWGSHTLGPMQVHTTTRLSDRDGVVVGSQQLRKSFDTTNEELTGRSSSRYTVIKMALAKYNRDEHYIEGVLEVLHMLWAQVATEYRTDFETMYRY